MVNSPAKQQLELAQTFLEEAESSLEAGNVRAGFSRVYYALYHSVQAALEVAGSDPKTHEGVINQFGRHYSDDPRFTDSDFTLLAQSQTFREMADYQINPSASLDEDRLNDLLEKAEELLGRAETVVEQSRDSGNPGSS